MKRLLITSGLAILALIALVIALPSAEQSAASGSISQIYVDTDISGTTITDIDEDGDTNLDKESVTLGAVDECREIAVDETVTIDVVAADWPAGFNLVGVEVVFGFDDTIIDLVDSSLLDTDTFPLLLADPDSVATDLPVSRADQNLAADIVSVFDKNADEDLDGEANSPGPLARVDVKGLAVGQSTISLTTKGAFVLTHDEDGRYVPVDEVRNGFISVGQPCVPGAQPGPAPVPPGAPLCPLTPDADGDGFSNCAEEYLGSDWASACQSASPPGNPFDRVYSLSVTITDILNWRIPYWGGQTALADYDIDGETTLLDWYPMLDFFTDPCVGTPLPCVEQPWWTAPPPWGLPAGDVDCDGYSSADEGTIGTDPDEDCGFTVGGATASDTWPPDLVESNVINISDVLALKPVFGTAVPPTSARFDLVVSGGINISDVLALKPFFGDSCPP